MPEQLVAYFVLDKWVRDFEQGFIVIAFDDGRLLHTETEDVSYSPFTLVFERAGIGIAAALMVVVRERC